MPGLRIRTEIGAPPERCFDLSRSIDLHVESMAASRERAVAGVTSGLIGFGQEVSWEARHFGRTWHMTSRITEFEPPRRFVDEMVRGPFTRFRHEHRFEPSNKGTLMTDLVEFQMPGWVIVNTAGTAYLRHLLVIRNTLIRAEAERG
jgi:ligand-binding SRPBCC domain-containing protein